MGTTDKSSSFNFHGIMANTTWDNTYHSQEFIEPTTKYNDSELFLHPPTPMSYYPPLPIVSNKDGHVSWSTSSSGKSYNPQPYPISGNETSAWCVADYLEHQQTDSDITLSCIEQMLMQDTDDKVRSHHGETALRTMEEPFYKLLGHQHPVLPQLVVPLCSCNGLTDSNASKLYGQTCNTCCVNVIPTNCHSNGNIHDLPPPWTLSAIVGEAKQSPLGAERMGIGLNINDLSITKNSSYFLEMNAEDTIKHASFQVQGRKFYPSIEDLHLLEGRRNKQFAIFSDEPTRNEMFDKVLLCCENKPVDEDTIFPQTMADKSAKDSQNGQARIPGRQTTTRGKTRKKKEVVDLRALLIQCADAVSVDNRSIASDTLKSIRQHCSPRGDDSQRLAFYLADCLEVRLSGNGSQINHKVIATPVNATHVLKLFHLCYTVCPYLRSSYHFSNKTILDVSKGKPQVHIIDFGICFGFQWPSLLKQFANREGGPPKLRITGLELPQPGFRPDEMNKNTWLRLVEYANMFKVTLEYRQIASKWEAISIEDLNIDEDEVLVVNCINRMKNLGDETISINSARNRVLNTIRKMKPNVFIHGDVNGSYSTPFFLSRFKEVMYHYTSLFDMLDKTTPRDNETRMVLERDIYRNAILNVIACEGSERTERPESYKKWKVRSLRARFEQLPLNPATVIGVQSMVRQIYHKDYFVDEDDQYLVLGWKGRILYALSTWKPKESGEGD